MADLFIAERTGLMRRSLRRFTYRSENPCPDSSDWGHEARAMLDVVPDDDSMISRDGTPLNGRGDDSWPHDDPRWPASCAACGYAFADEDRWQFSRDELLSGTEYGTPQHFTIQDAPPGAMIRAPWLDNLDRKGESWLVILPDRNQWHTTARAGNMDGTLSDRGWNVVGTPPKITVTPSIWANAPHGWHGWIRDGKLVSV